MTAALLAAFALVKKIPAWLWVAFACLLLILCYGFAMYHLGGSAERGKLLQHSIEALRERRDINEDYRALPNAALCERLGGLPDECKHL